jgi:RNA ligase
MTTIADLFDLAALDVALADGYVRAQAHPTLPLRILNYTEKAQYEARWTPVTLACRGLIVAVDGTVVARPLPKFFNYGQAGAPVLDLHSPAEVTDKADGSLGVLFPTPDGIAVATRGSFASDQAVHATDVLKARYPGFTPPAHLTVLVEIIYPSNRIVIDYAGLDDLVLLGAVEVATGRSVGPDAVPGWPGPVIDRLPHATLAEALAAPPRANREGVVVWLPSADVRVKIKYEEYVRLHRIVTGLNARTVWEALVAGRTVAEFVDGLPDEFHPWVARVAAELEAAVEARAAGIEAAYAQIVAGLPDGWTRKDFALVAATHPERGPLFMRLDRRDYRPHLWDRARPEADWTPSGRVIGDDEA